jgi:hypothetical protein
MLIGFAERDITPISDKIMPGDFWPVEVKEAPHGKLLVTAAAFTSGDESVILISMDILSSTCAYADKLRERISEATGVPVSNILVAAIHTHTGPLVEYPVWTTPASPETSGRTADLTVEAAKAAWENRAEAKLGVGKTREIRYSFNRDFYMVDGSVLMNPGNHEHEIVRPAGGVDHSVDVMRVDDMDGNIKCFIVNYANHPDCHQKNKKSFSGDFPAALRRGLKRVYGEGVFVLFFNGPCGDVNCIDWLGTTSDSYYGGIKNAPEAIGAGLTSTVVQINADIKADNTAPEIKAISKDTILARRYKTDADYAWAQEIAKDMESHNAMDRAFATEYIEKDDDVSPEVEFEIYTIRLGDWAIVGLPSEIFTDIGRRIKTASPFENTLIFELSNGTHGYIATKIVHESTAYESKVSKYNAYTAKDSGDRIVEAALRQLEELKNA